MVINKNQKVYIYFFCFFSLILSSFLGENSSGGSRLDNQITRQFIVQFSSNYLNGIQYFISSGQIQSPLFYILIASIEKIFNEFFIKYLYLIISSSISLVFYTSLKKKFQTVNKHNLFILSLIIFFSPFFRSSAVWITTDNLAILFFILSISKYLSFEKKNDTKNLFQCVIYLSIAVYIRQYYIIFFVFYFIKFIKFLSLKKLVSISLFLLLIFIPFALYYYYFLQVNLIGSHNLNLKDSPLKLDPLKNLLIFLSLYFFYTIPFYINILFEIKKYIFKYFLNYFILFLSFIFIYFLYEVTFYEFGGGIFVKISQILQIKEIFYISSFFGAILLSKNLNSNNMIVYFCLIFAFPTAIVYQKYFDPLLILVILTLTEKDTIDGLIKLNKLNLKYLFSYFFLFLVTSNLYYL
jgi:hypothetical protein